MLLGTGMERGGRQLAGGSEGRSRSGVQEGGAGKGRCGGETLAADSCFAVLAPRYPGNYTIDRPEAGDNLLHTYVSLPSDCFQGSVLYNR